MNYAIYLNETAQETENTETINLTLGRRDLLTILTGMELTQTFFPDSLKSLTEVWKKIGKEIDSQKDGKWA